MAAVKVGTSTAGLMDTGKKASVRTSAGIPYVCYYAVPSITMWKGNSTTPASFAEQDAASKPTRAVGRFFSQPEIAIDSNDVIHIVYCDNKNTNGETDWVYYVTFDTVTDTWGAPESVWSITNKMLVARIDIDSNDVPHVAIYTSSIISPPACNYPLWYTNRIGGSWMVAPVLVDGSLTDTSGYDAVQAVLCIDPDNIPMLAYHRNTRTAADRTYCFAIGDANDATSFTNKLVTVAKAVNGPPTIGIDKDENKYVGFYFDNNDDPPTGDGLTIWKHAHGAAWATWTEIVPGYISSYPPGGPEMGLVVDGSVLYAFWTKTLNAFNDDGRVAIKAASWSDNATDAAADYQGPGKWQVWVDNDSTGTNRGIAGGRSEIDFLFKDTSGYVWFETMAATPQPPAATNVIVMLLE